ncbi:Isochorismatase family protein YecD [Thalassocella blandensis]|nr:Isochorismatase family protein YecD [Thalassocella blandensis]
MTSDAALLVIDQQKGIDHPKLGERNNPQAENVILSLLDFWRTNSWPVFHIQHRSREPDSVFWPHQPGYDFKPAFVPRAEENHLVKSTPCAFVGTQLEQTLRSLSCANVVITGVATNNSVESTARTAGNLGYSVTVVADACFGFAKLDFNGLQRSAEEVHAMSLANLDGEYARVCFAQDVLNSLVQGQRSK